MEIANQHKAPGMTSLKNEREKLQKTHEQDEVLLKEGYKLCREGGAVCKERKNILKARIPQEKASRGLMDTMGRQGRG